MLLDTFTSSLWVETIFRDKIKKYNNRLSTQQWSIESRSLLTVCTIDWCGKWRVLYSIKRRIKFQCYYIAPPIKTWPYINKIEILYCFITLLFVKRPVFGWDKRKRKGKKRKNFNEYFPFSWGRATTVDTLVAVVQICTWKEINSHQCCVPAYAVLGPFIFLLTLRMNW